MVRRPVPPADVVIVCKDGTCVPVELAYEGRQFSWRHLRWFDQWMVTARVRANDFDHLDVGMLPPHTDLKFVLLDQD